MFGFFVDAGFKMSAYYSTLFSALCVLYYYNYFAFAIIIVLFGWWWWWLVVVVGGGDYTFFSLIHGFIICGINPKNSPRNSKLNIPYSGDIPSLGGEWR